MPYLTVTHKNSREITFFFDGKEVGTLSQEGPRVWVFRATDIGKPMTFNSPFKAARFIRLHYEGDYDPKLVLEFDTLKNEIFADGDVSTIDYNANRYDWLLGYLFPIYRGESWTPERPNYDQTSAGA